MWAVQAGTAVSSRLRHGANNSVNLIRYADGQRPTWHCNIERWDFQPHTRRFMPVTITALELDRSAATATR